MSGIIKAAEAKAVRSFDLKLVASQAVEPQPPVKSAGDVALEEALREIAALKDQRLSADKAAREMRDEAYAAGLKEGVEQAKDDAERRLAQLGKIGEGALAAWQSRIAGLDTLAVTLTRDALAKIFSPHADLADLVARAISAKAAQLQNQSVVAVRVSSKDFAAPTALAAGLDGVEVVVDPLLKAGECRIGLRLGEVDLSIDRLASALDDFLRSLGETA